MFNGASFVLNRSSGRHIRRERRDPANAAAGEPGLLDLVALRRYISLVEVYGFLGANPGSDISFRLSGFFQYRFHTCWHGVCGCDGVKVSSGGYW